MIELQENRVPNRQFLKVVQMASEDVEIYASTAETNYRIVPSTRPSIKATKTGPETAVDQGHLEMLEVVLSTILLAGA